MDACRKWRRHGEPPVTTDGSPMKPGSMPARDGRLLILPAIAGAGAILISASPLAALATRLPGLPTGHATEPSLGLALLAAGAWALALLCWLRQPPTRSTRWPPQRLGQALAAALILLQLLALAVGAAPELLDAVAFAGLGGLWQRLNSGASAHGTSDLARSSKAVHPSVEEVTSATDAGTLCVDSASASEPRRQNATVGRFQIVRRLGRGSMGAVYLARDPLVERLIALKVLQVSASDSIDTPPEARERFFREARAAARLQHPNIVSIFDVGESEGLAWIAMEYIEGCTLGRCCLAERLLPVDEVLTHAAAAARALHCAHCAGIVHRDIKPDNLMISSDNRLKITDFGIARLGDAALTRTGLVLGTPAYMSPEQVSGRPLDARSDIYSLGASLYHLLTGQLPFGGTTVSEVMRNIQRQGLALPSSIAPQLPGFIDGLLLRAMHRQPSARFASADDFAQALDAGARSLRDARG